MVYSASFCKSHISIASSLFMLTKSVSVYCRNYIVKNIGKFWLLLMVSKKAQPYYHDHFFFVLNFNSFSLLDFLFLLVLFFLCLSYFLFVNLSVCLSSGGSSLFPVSRSLFFLWKSVDKGIGQALFTELLCVVLKSDMLFVQVYYVKNTSPAMFL